MERRRGAVETFDDESIYLKYSNTVGGRVDMVNIPLFTRCYTSQVVQDFFHQQYHTSKQKWDKKAYILFPQQNSISFLSLLLQYLYRKKNYYQKIGLFQAGASRIFGGRPRNLTLTCRSGSTCLDEAAKESIGNRWVFPKIVGFPPKSSI